MSPQPASPPKCGVTRGSDWLALHPCGLYRANCAWANDRPTGSLDCSSKSEMATMIDPLSEVLRSVRLTGGIFLDAHFTAPWCVHTNILAEDCGAFLVKPPLLIAYHFVIAGRFLLSIEGEPTVEV